VKDALLQLMYIEGIELLSGLNEVAADNNGNSAIDSDDLMASLRQIVGLDTVPSARIVDVGSTQFYFDSAVTELYVIALGDADLSWRPTDLI